MATRRLISIAHSYVVGLNRRLAQEMARAGRDAWDVTAVAPEHFHGRNDLRPVKFSADADQSCELRVVSARWTRSPHLFHYGAALRQILREQKWDLVHCWEEPYVLAGAQVAHWMPRSASLVFWTLQNLDKKYPPPFAGFERYCVRRCAGWMACGQTTREVMLRRGRGYDLKPSCIVPLGVDTELFRPDAQARVAVRRELDWPDTGPPVVGFLGRFAAEKGVGFLIRVLDESRAPWRALFVGAGPMERELRSFAERSPDRVRICTTVTHAQVPAYLNAMDVLAAPSRTTPRWREQFGRMLIEAFATGVPVIGSNSGEIPHVIGDAGIICGEDDRAGWTASLSELLESPQRRAEYAARGRERAELYVWPRIARQQLEFFDEVTSVAARTGV